MMARAKRTVLIKNPTCKVAGIKEGIGLLIEEHDPLHGYSAITSENVLGDRSDGSGI